MKNPKVSIIIPVYNVENYIKTCFNSLLNQTFSDYEVIIIDDGSTDTSGQICDEYVTKDSRFKVYHRKNQGAGRARNFGLDVAIGQYIYFVDADDWLDEDALEVTVNEMNKVDMVIGCSKNCFFNKDKLVASKIEYYYPSNKYFTKDQVRKMYVDIAVNGVSHAPHNKMYKKSIIDRYEIRFPDYKKYEDLTFNNEYIDKINSLIILEDNLYNYRVSNLQGIAQKLPANMFEIFTMVNNDLIYLLNKWEVMDERARYMLKSKYISDVASCINNAYNPNLKFTLRDKYLYIKRIVNDKKVKTDCKKVNGSIFVVIISKLINLRAVSLIMASYRMKIIIKRIRSVN